MDGFSGLRFPASGLRCFLVVMQHFNGELGAVQVFRGRDDDFPGHNVGEGEMHVNIGPQIGELTGQNCL